MTSLEYLQNCLTVRRSWQRGVGVARSKRSHVYQGATYWALVHLDDLRRERYHGLPERFHGRSKTRTYGIRKAIDG